MGEKLSFEIAAHALRTSRDRTADFREPLMRRILDHRPRGPRDVVVMLEAIILERTEGTRSDDRDLEALKRVHLYVTELFGH
ncbi:MAG: hypothetical protein LCH57_01990 [Proteobacteria bacterium]|nr:hypothetical protein [Pseudomonadota bacterium]